MLFATEEPVKRPESRISVGCFCRVRIGAPYAQKSPRSPNGGGFWPWLLPLPVLTLGAPFAFWLKMYVGYGQESAKNVEGSQEACYPAIIIGAVDA